MALLENKVAIITGAGRKGGLGESIAQHFASEGAKVIITDIGKPTGKHITAEHIGSDQELKEVAHSIQRVTNGVVDSMVCDVLSEESISSTIQKTISKMGRLDIVVNNAGIGYIMKPLTELSISEWDVVLNVNLRGPWLFTKHAANQFIKQGTGGRIINIASQAAKSPAPLLSHYTSSKHGLIGLTRTAAVELGEHGITVNAVCPNHVTTGLGALQNKKRGQVMNANTNEVLQYRASKIPIGRVGLTKDTATACVFLASDNASYITGEGLNVSGGEEMH